jgi:uncharacterized membrane protein
MTRAGDALRLALRDFYDNSWRLVLVNAAVGAVLVTVGVLTFAVHAALVLLVLAGPVLAALVHVSVTLVREGTVRLSDARDGFRAHWRRGLVLGSVATAFAVLAAVALHVYATGSPLTLPLAFLTLYVVFALAVYQVVLWTLAVASPERPLRELARTAALVLLRRPGSAAALGLTLAVVNIAGIVVAVMPFLTLTVAYSFLAVAHFTLEQEPA